MDEEAGAWMRKAQTLSGGAEEKGLFFTFIVGLAWTWLSAYLHSRTYHLLSGCSSKHGWKMAQRWLTEMPSGHSTSGCV